MAARKRKREARRKVIKVIPAIKPITPPVFYYVLFDGAINSTNTTKLLKAIIYNAATYKADKIVIFFSSWGGNIYEGFKLATIIQNSKIPVVIHATSNIDSIANVIYLSAKERSAESHAKFYMHGSSAGGGDIRELNDSISAVTTNNTRIAYFISENTNLKLEDVKSKMDAGTTISAQEALKCGITHEIVHGKIPDGVSREDIIDIE